MNNAPYLSLHWLHTVVPQIRHLKPREQIQGHISLHLVFFPYAGLEGKGRVSTAACPHKALVEADCSLIPFRCPLLQYPNALNSFHIAAFSHVFLRLSNPPAPLKQINNAKICPSPI